MARTLGLRQTSLAVAISLLSCVAYAGDESGDIVADWHIYGDAHSFFDLTGTHNNSPCLFPERWALDTTTTAGRAQYAAFLTAVTTGKTVQIGGDGTCAHGNTERVFTIRVAG